MANSKSRSTDHVRAAVEACFGRCISAGQRLVVGLSGGVDSIVLLHCLRELVPRWRANLAALHVHHGLSPNAGCWAAHCRGLCADWDIPLDVVQVAVERGSDDGLEAAARRARHEAFAKTPGDWIVLGHHRGDQAETLLFNLLRGTGLRGASAMSETNGRLLRPLLCVGRDRIAGYAREHDLPWVEDESNADTRLSRNYLRHEVLARLDARFPGCTGNLAAATSRFAEALTLLDQLAIMDLGAHAPEFPLPIDVLTVLDEPRGRNLLRYLLQRRHVGIPSESRLREALHQIVHAAPDRHPAVGLGSWRILRRGRQVVLEPAPGG